MFSPIELEVWGTQVLGYSVSSQYVLSYMFEGYMFSPIELQVWRLHVLDYSVSSQYVLSYRFWNYKVRATGF